MVRCGLLTSMFGDKHEKFGVKGHVGLLVWEHFRTSSTFCQGVAHSRLQWCPQVPFVMPEPSLAGSSGDEHDAHVVYLTFSFGELQIRYLPVTSPRGEAVYLISCWLLKFRSWYFKKKMYILIFYCSDFSSPSRQCGFFCHFYFMVNKREINHRSSSL